MVDLELDSDSSLSLKIWHSYTHQVEGKGSSTLQRSIPDWLQLLPHMNISVFKTE